MRFLLTLLAPLAIVGIFLHVLWGMLVAVFLFPLLGADARDALVRFWSRLLLVIVGIRLDTRLSPGGGGTPDETAAADLGSLLLLNHVSWIDVFVLAAVIPVRFVSKSEVAHWPLFGRLAVAVGTLFVERGRRHAVAAVNHLVAHRLQSGQSIAIFPEGTTTEGDRVLRFHANLVQAAIDTGAPVRPVGIRYTQDGGVSRAAAYVGDTHLGESVWSILVAPRLAVEVHWLAPISVEGLHRQEIGTRARAEIVAALGLPDHEPVAWDPDAGAIPSGSRASGNESAASRPQ